MLILIHLIFPIQIFLKGFAYSKHAVLTKDFWDVGQIFPVLERPIMYHVKYERPLITLVVFFFTLFIFYSLTIIWRLLTNVKTVISLCHKVSKNTNFNTEKSCLQKGHFLSLNIYIFFLILQLWNQCFFQTTCISSPLLRDKSASEKLDLLQDW